MSSFKYINHHETKGNKKKKIDIKKILKETREKARVLLLRKLSSYFDDFNSVLINRIIYNETSLLVANFKEFLIFEDFTEFMKKVYCKIEGQTRLRKILDFYQKYSKNFPNYTTFSESKYFYENIQRKQNLINIIKNKNIKINDNVEFDRYFHSRTIFSINNQSSFISMNSKFSDNDLTYENLISSIEKAENTSFVKQQLETNMTMYTKNVRIKKPQNELKEKLTKVIKNSSITPNSVKINLEKEVGIKSQNPSSKQLKYNQKKVKTDKEGAFKTQNSIDNKIKSLLNLNSIQRLSPKINDGKNLKNEKEKEKINYTARINVSNKTSKEGSFKLLNLKSINIKSNRELKRSNQISPHEDMLKSKKNKENYVSNFKSKEIEIESHRQNTSHHSITNILSTRHSKNNKSKGEFNLKEFKFKINENFKRIYTPLKAINLEGMNAKKGNKTKTDIVISQSERAFNYSTNANNEPKSITPVKTKNIGSFSKGKKGEKDKINSSNFHTSKENIKSLIHKLVKKGEKNKKSLNSTIFELKSNLKKNEGKIISHLKNRSMNVISKNNT